MTPLRQDTDVAAFLHALPAAPARVLATDFDGTLAPFAGDRDTAKPYPGVVEALERLRPATRLVVVSGRAARDVAERLPILPRPEIWGSHGYEHWVDGDAPRMAPLDAPARAGLQRAFESLAARGWEEAVERKPAGIAVHWRGRSPTVVDALRRAVEKDWALLTDGTGLEVLYFDGGVELRASARSKADAIRALFGGAGPGPAVAYLGDDVTDESAFEAVRGRGLAILVRPEWRPTAADLWLRPPRELLAFLDLWRRTCEGGTP